MENDQITDFSEIIEERSFLGEYPIHVIFENIQKQFEDYINTGDDNNYVDIFYNQLALSFEKIEIDESESHPEEIRDVLYTRYHQFAEFIQLQCKTHLLITFPDTDNMHSDDLEFMIRRVYEFFILRAKNNFKVAISNDVISRIQDKNIPQDELFHELQEMINDYSPLINSINCIQFMQSIGDKEMCEMFESGQFNGNFLKKYSPRFYQNDDFVVEVVNYITSTLSGKVNIEEGE
jgi:hypothetical protein